MTDGSWIQTSGILRVTDATSIRPQPVESKNKNQFSLVFTTINQCVPVLVTTSQHRLAKIEKKSKTVRNQPEEMKVKNCTSARRH